jgi:hypothetical protein
MPLNSLTIEFTKESIIRSLKYKKNYQTERPESHLPKRFCISLLFHLTLLTNF